MLTKLIALNPVGYLRDVMNIGDGLIVFVSILDICILF